MKVSVIASRLEKALKQCKEAIGDNAISFHDRVFIKAAPDMKSLDVTGIGSTLTVVVNVPATIEDFNAEDSTFSVLASRLMAGVGNALEEVTLSVFSNRVDVHGSRFDLHLKRYPSASFIGVRDENGEPLGASDPDAECEISAASFREMLRKTAYAADYAGIANKPQLKCVSLSVKASTSVMRLAATDGRRLSFVETEVYLSSKNEGANLSLMLSKRVIGAIRALAETDGEVWIARKASRGYIYDHDGKWTVCFSLPNDEYPSINPLIPEMGSARSIYTFDREQLITSLKIAGEFDAEIEKSRGVKIEFSESSKAMKVSIVEEEEVVATSELPAFPKRAQRDEHFVVHCRAKFLLEILKSHDDDEMSFEYYGDGKPVALRSSIPALALIMPMRVD